MPTFKISHASDVLHATETLVSSPRFPAPAHASLSMDVLSQAVGYFGEFGRYMNRVCRGYMEPQATRAAFENLANIFASIPVSANKVATNFLEAADTFRELDEVVGRPATSQSSITASAAANVQSAAFELSRQAGLPEPADGAPIMIALADTMRHISTLGEKLDGKAEIGAKNAVTPTIAGRYDWLARHFKALRHNANETRGLFLSGADGFVQLKRATDSAKR